jgi:hypothetical protein
MAKDSHGSWDKPTLNAIGNCVLRSYESNNGLADS